MACLDDVFDLIDRNGDNDIAFDEVRDFLGSLPEPPPEDRLRQWFTTADSDGSGGIDRAELEAILVRVEAELSTPVVEVVACFKRAMYRRLFQLVDVDGGGSLDAGEVRRLIDALPVKATDEERRQALLEADANGNGEIDEDEFADMLEKFSRGVLITKVMAAFEKETEAARERIRKMRAMFGGSAAEDDSPPTTPRRRKQRQQQVATSSEERACCADARRQCSALEAEVARLREQLAAAAAEVEKQRAAAAAAAAAATTAAASPAPTAAATTVLRSDAATQTTAAAQGNAGQPLRKSPTSPPYIPRTDAARRNRSPVGGVPLSPHPLTDAVTRIPWNEYIAHSPCRMRSVSPVNPPKPTQRSKSPIRTSTTLLLRATPERGRGEWGARPSFDTARVAASFSARRARQSY
eukprot:TRINITY_DN39342_c0_g1_i1.p1 TRINITY_DN39342_c0_g1~~TRINITY_DN39342_c0_g1_i1.p1  ORF type:complete len:435 (+),score=109.83 TRINITY_DN39342_c0_g1_i1:78-1307(+)